VNRRPLIRKPPLAVLATALPLLTAGPGTARAGVYDTSSKSDSTSSPWKDSGNWTNDAPLVDPAFDDVCITVDGAVVTMTEDAGDMSSVTVGTRRDAQHRRRRSRGRGGPLGRPRRQRLPPGLAAGLEYPEPARLGRRRALRSLAGRVRDLERDARLRAGSGSRVLPFSSTCCRIDNDSRDRASTETRNAFVKSLGSEPSCPHRPTLVLTDVGV